MFFNAASLMTAVCGLKSATAFATSTDAVDRMTSIWFWRGLNWSRTTKAAATFGVILPSGCDLNAPLAVWAEAQRR